MEAQLTALPVLLPAEPQFRCPDEPHTISRSVHLARLAAFYPKCRHCQHRHDTGHLPPTVVEQIQHVERQRAPQRQLFQLNGVRGVFHNDLTPAIAGRIAGAFASLLWEQVPLTAKSIKRDPNSIVKRAGPMIALGYDDRPSSPVLFAMVADALRMMGCEVVDLGQVAQPCFLFAVDHLQAAGGVYITGSGCDASWNGLDFVGEGAIPLSIGTGLETVQQRWQETYSRPTRRAGFQRSFQALVPYEPSLWKHFQGLKPLKVVAAVKPRIARATLKNLFAKLPCELIEVETMTGQAPLRSEVLLTTLSQRVPRSHADLGVLIEDDASGCQFVDEKGRRIDPYKLSMFLARSLLVTNPHAGLCVTSSRLTEVTETLQAAHVFDGGESAGSLAQSLQQHSAVMGITTDARCWWREACPTADAILTVARVLQALSRSDAPLSVREKRSKT